MMLYLGHGLSHKARILSRFKKRFSSKNTKTNKKETFHIKPLAVERDECIIYSQSLLNERYLFPREIFLTIRIINTVKESIQKHVLYNYNH